MVIIFMAMYLIVVNVMVMLDHVGYDDDNDDMIAMIL